MVCSHDRIHNFSLDNSVGPKLQSPCTETRVFVVVRFLAATQSLTAMDGNVFKVGILVSLRHALATRRIFGLHFYGTLLPFYYNSSLIVNIY